MRFTRTPPASRDEFREQVLGHADAIVPGARVVASRLAVPGRGKIDILAADERGRLVLLTSALQITPAIFSRSLSQWDWLLHNLEMLRSLAPFEQCDLTIEPRLVLAGAALSSAACRLAGYVNRPEVELLQVTVVQAGDREGVLVDRLEPAAPPAAGEGADPLLGGMPPGEARSAARRVIERLESLCGTGVSMETVRLDGGIDLRVEDRTIATLLAVSSGLRLRMPREAAETAVSSEEDCEQAARLISAAAKEAPGARPAEPGPQEPRPGKLAPLAALTDEEIAEFEKIAGESVPAEESPAPSPGSGSAPAGFVEN